MSLDECKDTWCNIIVPDNCVTLEMTFLVIIYNEFYITQFFGINLQFNLSVLLREERGKSYFNICNLTSC